MRYELFSKRQKRIRGEVPDVYQYETIPRELRVQVFYIWEKAWGQVYYDSLEELRGSSLAMEAYRFIEATLREEYGVLSLGEEDNSYEEEGGSSYEIVRNFLLETENIEKVIDVIEVSFRYIDQQIRTYHDKGIYDGKKIPDDPITKLNDRFREHNVGYQYESGLIIRVDSQFIHSEAVKPALSFLSNPIYKGANEEFLSAHKHYRKGRYKECLSDCLKAFESCMKIICGKRGWHHNKKDTANRLIETVFKHKLIDRSMTCHFTALISTLKSGVPTARNDKSGHGQGSEEIIVPEYIAAYILHLTASNILLLAKADEERH